MSKITFRFEKYDRAAKGMAILQVAYRAFMECGQEIDALSDIEALAVYHLLADLHDWIHAWPEGFDDFVNGLGALDKSTMCQAGSFCQALADAFSKAALLSDEEAAICRQRARDYKVAKECVEEAER